MKRLTQEEVFATWFAADEDCMAMLCAGIACQHGDWYSSVRFYQKDKTLVSACLDDYQKAKSVSDPAAWIDFQVAKFTTSVGCRAFVALAAGGSVLLKRARTSNA